MHLERQEHYLIKVDLMTNSGVWRKPRLHTLGVTTNVYSDITVDWSDAPIWQEFTIVSEKPICSILMT
jgi:hypothetical protein